MGWTVRDQIPGGNEIFRPSTPTLGPTQPPVKWVPDTVSGRKKEDKQIRRTGSVEGKGERNNVVQQGWWKEKVRGNKLAQQVH